MPLDILFTYPFVVLAFAFFVGFLVILCRFPSVRGRIGEWRVRRVLGKTEEGKQYVINDYIIEADGKSSQIDHILINRYGIFVIETKNYSGRIYGNDNQQEWTQVLQYGKVKHKLYNPVKQNATHIYRLKTVLGNAPFHSVVVFIQNNTHYIRSNSTIPLRKLKGVISRGAPVLQPADMERIFATLTEHRSSISTRQHVQNIRSQSAAIESNICPRCGSPLVKRNGQYGTFWGCSAYPKCKFIKKR